MMRTFTYTVLIIAAGVVLNFGCKKSSTAPESTIQYTDLNPDIYVGRSGDSTLGHWYLDLNADSVKDFVFYFGFIMPMPGMYEGEVIQVMPYDSNQILGNDTVLRTLLDKGREIPGSCSRYEQYFTFFDSHVSVPPWHIESDSGKYLGLSVLKNHIRYYGWVQLDWDREREILRIRDYAIQKQSDSLIFAGETQ